MLFIDNDLGCDISFLKKLVYMAQVPVVLDLVKKKIRTGVTMSLSMKRRPVMSMFQKRDKF